MATDDRDGRRGDRGVGEAFPRRGKLSEVLAQHLVRRIAAGEFRVGERLPNEAEMMRQFNVGRATLRECMRVLETYGLVVLRSGPPGGPVITHPDALALARTITVHLQVNAVPFRDLIEARVIMEPLLARLAAERISPGATQRIEAALRAGRGGEPSSQLLDVNVDFHRTLSSCSGNGVLDLTGRALNDIYFARRMSVNAGADKDTWEQTQKEHEAIGRAVMEGRASTAERLMRRHVEDFAAAFRKLYPWALDTVIDLDADYFSYR